MKKARNLMLTWTVVQFLSYSITEKRGYLATALISALVAVVISLLERK